MPKVTVDENCHAVAWKQDVWPAPWRQPDVQAVAEPCCMECSPGCELGFRVAGSTSAQVAATARRGKLRFPEGFLRSLDAHIESFAD